MSAFWKRAKPFTSLVSSWFKLVYGHQVVDYCRWRTWFLPKRLHWTCKTYHAAMFQNPTWPP